VGLGEIHTIDEAPIVREMQGLIGPLSDDEAALVRALTPADLSCSEMVQHMFELVDLLATVRRDEEMADYVYAIAPDWNDSIELLVLGGAISTAVERHELARAA
jgi:hypothetical protein